MLGFTCGRWVTWMNIGVNSQHSMPTWAHALLGIDSGAPMTLVRLAPTMLSGQMADVFTITEVHCLLTKGKQNLCQSWPEWLD